MKKVLIVATSFNESVVEKVIDWLIHFNVQYERLNTDKFFTQFNKDDNFSLKRLYSRKYHSIWIWRWDYSQYMEILSQDFEKNSLNFKLSRTLINNISNDYSKLLGYFFDSKIQSKYLSKPQDLFVDKLHVLRVANKLNLHVPKYIVTNSKAELISFFNKFKNEIVVKDLSDPFVYIQRNVILNNYVSKVDKEFIKKLPQKFGFSFFQEYIDKEFEVRAFIINSKVYSMAIFSQSSDSTKTDYRKYDFTNPNKYVPFQLPKFITGQILNLMKKLLLRTGSVDIIKSKLDNKYYFLEINPVGQFEILSTICNYNIEFEIAKYLKSN